MTYADRLDTDIETFLKRHERKDLLRFVTVGSVDDGKSTLIGRLLHDTHGVYEDHLEDARKANRTAGEIDFSLLTDGLRAEREQGITIDVAYRYFTTPTRKFIIADTPGHVQYTRNMATGASTADLAIILIDARLGVLNQSRRHAWIASLLGISHLVVAINKMDLMGWSQGVFDRLCADFSAVASRLSFEAVTFLPISALLGDNVVSASAHMPWYTGPTLLGFLEHVRLRRSPAAQPFRLPVQTVIRPNLDYRGFAGQIVSGVVRVGDAIKALPSGRTSRVKAIDLYEDTLTEAFAPLSVTVRLEDEIDVSRGDVLVLPGQEPARARHLRAHVVWMHDDPLVLGRAYTIKHTTRYVRAQFNDVAWRLDMETLDRLDAARLDLNDIGEVSVTCDRPLTFDAYADNRLMGAFIVIDPLSNTTLGAGMLIGPDLARIEAERSSIEAVGDEERALRLGQRPAVAWLHGPGAPHLASRLERSLFDRGVLPALLTIRDDADLRAVSALAQAGLVVLAIDPTAAWLDAARALLDEGALAPLHLDAPLDLPRAAESVLAIALGAKY